MDREFNVDTEVSLMVPEITLFAKFTKYISKMKGQGSCPTCAVALPELLCTILGSTIGMGLVTFISFWGQVPLLLPSLGATAVLVYGSCQVPMAQPRHVLGGHVLSALVGVFMYQYLGAGWLAITLAVTLSMVAMALTGTMHPPGGATAFVAVYTHQSWSYVLMPVGVGALMLIIVALLINNISSRRCYPQYW